MAAIAAPPDSSHSQARRCSRSPVRTAATAAEGVASSAPIAAAGTANAGDGPSDATLDDPIDAIGPIDDPIDDRGAVPGTGDVAAGNSGSGNRRPGGQHSCS